MLTLRPKEIRSRKSIRIPFKTIIDGEDCIKEIFTFDISFVCLEVQVLHYMLESYYGIVFFVNKVSL